MSLFVRHLWCWFIQRAARNTWAGLGNSTSGYRVYRVTWRNLTTFALKTKSPTCSYATG